MSVHWRDECACRKCIFPQSFSVHSSLCWCSSIHKRQMEYYIHYLCLQLHSTIRIFFICTYSHPIRGDYYCHMNLGKKKRNDLLNSRFSKCICAHKRSPYNAHLPSKYFNEHFSSCFFFLSHRHIKIAFKEDVCDIECWQWWRRSKSRSDKKR